MNMYISIMNQHEVKAVFLFSQANRDRLTKLAQWVDQNNVKVNIDKTFSLDEAAKSLSQHLFIVLYKSLNFK